MTFILISDMRAIKIRSKVQSFIHGGGDTTLNSLVGVSLYLPLFGSGHRAVGGRCLLHPDSYMSYYIAATKIRPIFSAAHRFS